MLRIPAQLTSGVRPQRNKAKWWLSFGTSPWETIGVFIGPRYRDDAHRNEMSCVDRKHKSGQAGCLKQRYLTYRDAAHRAEMSCGDRRHKSGQVGCLKQRCLTYRQEQVKGPMSRYSSHQQLTRSRKGPSVKQQSNQVVCRAHAAVLLGRPNVTVKGTLDIWHRSGLTALAPLTWRR
jgi:hypothetical protein